MHRDASIRLTSGPKGFDGSFVPPTSQLETDQLLVTGGVPPKAVTCLRVLGHGRAAEARLVNATDKNGTSTLCVEKVFRPGVLTRSIYRASYQAPFAYQYNAHAIRACFYRRRTAAAIIESMIPEARVAQPLYVRWDEESRAFVLASEYIRGRGVIPQPTDLHMMRRWLRSRLGKPEQSAPMPKEEIEELLDLMTRLEALLVQCGLTGSGWQVCKRAMVSTANLLRTESGYVVVDLESGIPSVLVPAYVMHGLQLRSLPLFDDLNAVQLQKWLAQNQDHLAATLGECRHQQLKDDVASLILHTDCWKRSEPAIGRRPWRLLTADFTSRYRLQVLERWQRCGIVSKESAARLHKSRRFFTRATYLLGLIPGRSGRFAQRLHSNAPYRQRVVRWLTDQSVRSQSFSELTNKKSTLWKIDGRIAPNCDYQQISAGFLTNWLLSKVTTPTLQRWLVDRIHRRNQLTRMFLLCASGRFQSEYGRLLIRSRIEQWKANARLTANEADQLNQQLADPGVNEYVRGFGLHLGLKLLLPLVMPLKVGGAAASVASGNPLYFLLMLMLVPMLRTGITLWRIMACRRAVSEFRQALLVGILPVVGSLAYPVQMYAKFSELSMFLLRDFASQVGSRLPIYGGKDSRVELMAIKSANVVAESLDLWLSASQLLTESTSSDLHMEANAEETSFRVGRWDRLVHQQMALLNRAEQRLPMQVPEAESPKDEPTASRHAA